MKSREGCHGPCDQGRKPCPCPHACFVEAEEPPEHDMLRVVLIDAVIAATITAAIAAIVLGVAG